MERERETPNPRCTRFGNTACCHGNAALPQSQSPHAERQRQGWEKEGNNKNTFLHWNTGKQRESARWGAGNKKRAGADKIHTHISQKKKKKKKAEGVCSNERKMSLEVMQAAMWCNYGIWRKNMSPKPDVHFTTQRAHHTSINAHIKQTSRVQKTNVVEAGSSFQATWLAPIPPTMCSL